MVGAQACRQRGHAHPWASPACPLHIAQGEYVGCCGAWCWHSAPKVACCGFFHSGFFFFFFDMAYFYLNNIKRN